MLDELVKTIVEETVRVTLKELGALEKSTLNTPEIMSTKQLADYLGMSVQWVYEHTKELPHEKIGRKTLFHKSEIDQWRKAKRQENESDKHKTIIINSVKSKSGLYKVI